MPLSNIPSDVEIQLLRQETPDVTHDGAIIHRLLNAIVEMKAQLELDDRSTIPTPPPGDDDDDIPRSTIIGVAPPPTLFPARRVEHRCAICLDEFVPPILPATCPSCGSQDVYPSNHAHWPCGSCGKTKEGIDVCDCPIVQVISEEEEDPVEFGNLQRV